MGFLDEKIAQLRSEAEVLRTKIADYYRFSDKFKGFRKKVTYIFAGFLSVIFLFVAWTIWDMPSFDSLENPNSQFATQILDRNGVLLGSLFEDQNRVVVKPGDGIPDTLIRALIATEDIRFYDHAGIDMKGTMNIALSFLIFDPRGGSTITQQLARNLYEKEVGSERKNVLKTIIRKLKEYIVSFYLERTYSKDEILTYYLNTVAFGSTVYGISMASKFYFQKDYRKLELHEAALLVGLLKGPSYYNPFKVPQRALDRRNTVIEQMLKYELISETQAKRAKKKPLDIKGKGATLEYHSEGLGPYFREYIRLYMKEWCKKRGLDVYRDGLKIYTTIDARLQKHSEEAMREHLKDLQKDFDTHLGYLRKKPWQEDSSILHRAMGHSARYNEAKKAGLSPAEIHKEFHTKIPMKVFVWDAENEYEKDTVLSPWDSLAYYAKFLQPGLVSIEPSTGRILAWVGGINHRFFKYDHVEHGKRQVGSTFKPFVYAAAFDNGMTPCDKELNQPPSIPQGNGKVWRPENADGSVGGEITLKKALAFSLNTISARVIHKVGPPTVAEYASKLGVTSPIEPVYSIALGTVDMNVIEITSGYASMMNLGRWIQPHCLLKVEDKNGNLIETFVPDTREGLSPKSAYMMVDMLRAVCNEGTASGVRWIGQLHPLLDIAGKTGTTQNHSDGWFVGSTPDICTGIWIGCDDRSVHFSSLAQGSGSRMAMPIWAKYMNKAYNDAALNMNPLKRFKKPKDFNDDDLDCKKKKEKEDENPDDKNDNGVVDFN